MFNFQFDIPTPVFVLFASALVLIIPYVFLSLRPLWKVRNAIRKQAVVDEEPNASSPVSVIVYASDEAESLRKLLPSILGQRYNGPFEVIVVNEGRSDSTSEVVERLRIIHDNLYLTYTPDGARQLSRKKLALMIGIKAARYPVVVQTTASAVIDSDMWLARMTEPFENTNTEVVLGYSALDPEKDKGFGRRSRTFNASADNIIWLAAALDKRPYRGTELSLAYTRDVFFRNRGFSKSLNLKYGDDDIFVNEVVNRHNTVVVLHPEAKVIRNTWNQRRVYRELRSRYNFTGQYIPHWPRRANALGNWLLWVITALCVIGAAMMWPNLLGVAIAIFVVLGLVVVSSVMWSRVIDVMTDKKLRFTLPVLIYVRPFANIVSKIKSARYKKSNYTWIK